MCKNDVIDSVAVKYGDFSKAANDFLSKDFPAGSIKVEGKTLSLPNKVKAKADMQVLYSYRQQGRP